MKEQSKSIALLAEFNGQKIQGKTIAILSQRIDGLISLAVAHERRCCQEIAKEAWCRMSEYENR
jgi:hypothetical protein